MLVEVLVHGVLAVVVDLVNVHVVVVGTNSQEFLAWRVSYDFAPLLRILKRLDLFVEVLEFTD